MLIKLQLYSILKGNKSALQQNLTQRYMSKFYKTYRHNKKESNISAPLRFSFLKSIFIEGLSVKNAAAKWKMHYSSAKVIAREAKKAGLDRLFEEEAQKIIPKSQCGWKEIKGVSRHDDPLLSDKEEESCKVSPNTVSYIDFLNINKSITIVSTIGWDYMPVDCRTIVK